MLNQQRLSQKVMKAEADDSSFCKVGLGRVRKWSIVFMSFDNFLNCPGSTSAFSWSRSFRAQSRRIGKVSPFFHHLPTVELATNRLKNLPNNAHSSTCASDSNAHTWFHFPALWRVDRDRTELALHCGIGIGLEGARNYHPRAYIYRRHSLAITCTAPVGVALRFPEREREKVSWFLHDANGHLN